MYSDNLISASVIESWDMLRARSYLLIAIYPIVYALNPGAAPLFAPEDKLTIVPGLLARAIRYSRHIV